MSVSRLRCLQWTYNSPRVDRRPLRLRAFELDPAKRRLFAAGEPVAISDRQLDVLLLLVERAGQIVSKDDLIEAGWKDVAVGDNSLEQAISSLRRLLGRPPAASLTSRPSRGAAIASARRSRAPAPRESDAGLEALLAPHRAFIEGRAALETPRARIRSRARERCSRARSQRAPELRVGACRPGQRLRHAVRDDARRPGARSRRRSPSPPARARGVPARSAVRRSVGDARVRARSDGRGARRARRGEARRHARARQLAPPLPPRRTSAGAKSGCARRTGRWRSCRISRWRTGWPRRCTSRGRCSPKPSASCAPGSRGCRPASQPADRASARWRCTGCCGLHPPGARRRGARARTSSSASWRARHAAICTRASAPPTPGTRSARCACARVAARSRGRAFAQRIARVPAIRSRAWLAVGPTRRRQRAPERHRSATERRGSPVDAASVEPPARCRRAHRGRPRSSTTRWPPPRRATRAGSFPSSRCCTSPRSPTPGRRRSRAFGTARRSRAGRAAEAVTMAARRITKTLSRAAS